MGRFHVRSRASWRNCRSVFASSGRTTNPMLFAIQVYQKIVCASLAALTVGFDGSGAPYLRFQRRSAAIVLIILLVFGVCWRAAELSSAQAKGS